MTESDPVALAVESALTPSLAEAAAEVDAWTRAMAGRAVNGWDFTAVGPAPDFPRLRLRSVRVLVEHAHATDAPCVSAARSMQRPSGRVGSLDDERALGGP